MQQQDKKILRKLGKRVQELRKEQERSLNSFALNKGITPATLSRIENGIVDLKFTTLVKISSALEISLDEMLKNLDFKYNLE